MVPYHTLKDAKERVLQMLRRSGDLSYSELVVNTDLPYDLADFAVNELKGEGVVTFEGSEIEGLRLIRLRKAGDIREAKKALGGKPKAKRGPEI